MEMWSFSCEGSDYVLRRYRGGAVPESFISKLRLEDEARIIEVAASAGVTVPDVVGVLEEQDGLGPGFVMARADGIALPRKLFKDPKYEASLSSLTNSFGCELALLHAADAGILSDILSSSTPADCLARIKEDLAASKFQNPVLAAALRWLETNVPDAGESQVLLHGDFRMGNLLINQSGLSAVLDWELAHFGCAEKDLTWICMPSWRFGRYHLEAGGVGTREQLIESYERHSGRKVDVKRFEWYLIYSSLSWGLMTALMARMWREGEDRSLERILIGTRISEVETDLLLLLEEVAGVEDEPALEFDVPDSKPMMGDVEPFELIESAHEYLLESVTPKQTGAGKFHALIAANALSIAQRMTEHGSVFAERRSNRLAEIGHTESSLYTALRTGEANWQDRNIHRHIRLLCLERLTIHQPKYAAIKVALKKWSRT